MSAELTQEQFNALMARFHKLSPAGKRAVFAHFVGTICGINSMAKGDTLEQVSAKLAAIETEFPSS